LQSIVARNIDPIDSAVVSLTMFHAGDVMNVIPQTAQLCGTVRTLEGRVRDLVERRMHEICAGMARMHAAKIEFKYQRGYPVTVNHEAQTHFAAAIAKDVVGEKNVDEAVPPVLGGEDFSYMLEARPGAFIFVGNGNTAGVHHPAYDFNDEAIPAGCSYWARLVEVAMPS
jgi:hippurate hydrolase